MLALSLAGDMKPAAENKTPDFDIQTPERTQCTYEIEKPHTGDAIPGQEYPKAIPQ